MSLQGVWQGTFSFFTEKSIVVEQGSAQLSSDAGLLVFREFDDQIRWTEQFASALVDRRVDAEHSPRDMVRMRAYGILADYEDQNDHSTLRKDPLFKLITGRSPDDPDLASQSTLSRFENAVESPRSTGSATSSSTPSSPRSTRPPHGSRSTSIPSTIRPTAASS